ncbi:MAG: phosphatase PAP2 family protein [Novosphingobium sp.]|jgi:hypothetical protein|uniref:phosphatase PAP2 family protein n=1 Tax=Novosphingobium sp. TaxID=1874826 RepID=UPI00391AEB15
MQLSLNFSRFWRGAARVLGLSDAELAGCLIVAGLAIFPRVLLECLSGSYNLPPVGQGDYPFVVFALSILAIIAVLRPLYLVITRHPAPTRQLVSDIRSNRGWIVLVAFTVVALPETLDTATRFKKIIPQLNPFYADPFLADMERQILGKDAWQYTHAMFGPATTRAIDVIYGLWHAVNIGALVWIVLSREGLIKIKAAICYQLVWLVMGAGMAIAFSSAGPCFFEHFTGDPRFRPLMEKLAIAGGEDGLHAVAAMKYLLATQGTNAIGGGISAMPSLHVALAAFVVLLVRELWPRRNVPLLLALLHFCAVLIGSVHLGYHYLADGVVGTIGVMVIWAATDGVLKAFSNHPERTGSLPASHQSTETTTIETSPSTR